MYGSDAGQPVPSLYTKGLSPLCDIYMNVQNMLLMFHMHSLVCSWIVQLVLGTALILEYLCDNIGLVLVYLPSVTTSPSRYITQPSGIPILSPVLFMHVGDPYIPLF